MINQETRIGKEAGVVILLSDKGNFKPKVVRKDKEGHYMSIKEEIPQEDITLLIYIH
jgi:hypothetical protein